MPRKNIIIQDTTLRDGNQAPDVWISHQARYEIARRLLDAGVDEIEAGIPAIGAEERRSIRTLAERYPDSLISAWCRLREADIIHAGESGVSGIHLCLPFSDYHLSATAMTWEAVTDRLQELYMKYRPHFPFISIGLQDAFRARSDYLEEIHNVALALNVDRIRISDTVGSAFPSEVTRLISKFRSASDAIPLEFHAHNDFGLATANTLAAIEAGAEVVDVTVNGIGERAGNCPLAEIAVVLSRSEDFSTHVRHESLWELSQLVSRLTGRSIPVDKPLVGGAVFTHTSGIHCHAMQYHQLAYQPLDPASLGRIGAAVR